MKMQDRLREHNLSGIPILRHGFASYMRDYDLVVEANWEDGPGSYLYRFTHCPEAHLTSRIRDDVWRISWDNLYTQDALWEAANAPGGFVWGVLWAMADPGIVYRADSPAAAEWSARLDKPMHEVRIETNVFQLQLIFHDIVVRKLSDEAEVLAKFNIPIRNL